MSNKTFRKAALSTIGASAAIVAVAPAVSADSVNFVDVNEGNSGDGAVGDAYKPIMELAEQGIVNGKTEDRFYPWENVTRGQVAKMLANAQGLDTPEDVDGVLSDYNDVDSASDYADWIASTTEAGIFGGENGKFNEYDDLSREQMASALVRAFDLEDYDTGDDVEINKDHISEQHKDAVQTLANMDITKERDNFRAYDNISRAQFSSMLYRTMEVVGTGENKEAEIDDVSAINNKTLKVDFNKDVNVKEEDFNVKKGSTDQNISEVKMSKDMDSAEIKMDSKLTEGKYEVTVERKGEDDLTGSVDVDNEKVDGVEILSDKAPVNSQSEPENAKVGYQVTNQYDEDVTDSYGTGLDVQVSGSSVSGEGNPNIKKDGTLEFELDTDKAEPGDKVTITLIDRDTGVNDSKTVELSDEAVAKDISFGDLYNKDDKTLDEDTDVDKNKFYLPIELEDQYGKKITDEEQANKDLVLTNTNPGVAEFDHSNAEDNNDATVKEVTIDGDDVLALQVDKVDLNGTADVIVVPRNGGQNAKGSVTVEKGVKVDSMSIGKPDEEVTAEKKVLFPLTLTDSEGNEVTTKDEYKKLKKKDEISLPDHSKVVEKKDKGLFLEYDGGHVKEDKAITVVITTQSGQSATQTVTPKAEAKPKEITSLKDDVSTAIRTGHKKEIENTDLIVEDQYGQRMDKDQLRDLEFTAKSTDEDTFTVEDDSAAKKHTIEADDSPKKDSADVEFELKDVDHSQYKQKFTTVKNDDFDSYSVKDIDDIYVEKGDEGKTPDAYQKEVKVQAETDSGDTVDLDYGDDNNEFTVKSKDVELQDNKIVGYDKKVKSDKDYSGEITVTINETGDEITKDVNLSSKAPEAEKVELREDGDKLDDIDVSNETVEQDSFLGNLYFEDQYGVTSDDKDSSKVDENELEINFSDLSGDGSIKKNGTTNAQVVGFANDDSVKAKLMLGNDDTTVKVNGTKTSEDN